MDTLSAMGLDDYIRIDTGIVRGLAYYTGFVFEIFQANGEGRAIAGGGRYDNLIEKLCGVAMPAVGIAFGDYTFLDLLEANKLKPTIISKPDACCIFSSEAGRKAALHDAQLLRKAGHYVEYTLKPDIGFSKQLKSAGQAGARLALIYGEDELARGVIKVRDLDNRMEADVPREQILQAFRTLLEEGVS